MKSQSSAEKRSFKKTQKSHSEEKLSFLPMLKERKKIIIITVVVLVFVLIFGRLLFELIKLSPVLFQLTFDKKIELKKSEPQKINILLLGVGGGKHEGPNLSDTIIFASIDETKNKVTMVSIPRDLWVPDLKAKINTAYAYGEEEEKGKGKILAKTVVSKILDQKIDYILRIDFDGFIKAVDMVGGLDVQVDKPLDDYAYPVEGKENDTCENSEQEVIDLTAQIATNSATEFDAFPCRYKYLHVDAGLQHMDGELALEFSRSRHALGDEGTDFARSARQSKVISAFKSKLLSAETILNPIKIMSLYDTLKQNIDTDIEQTEFDDFIKLFQKMKGAKIESIVLDMGDLNAGRKGLLTSPDDLSDFGGQWVLIPASGSGNFKEIQKFVDCEIKIGNCFSSLSPIPTQSFTIKQ